MLCRGWDADLASAAEAAGATLLDDSSPVHSMRFESPAHCFEVFHSSCDCFADVFHLKEHLTECFAG